MIMVEARGSDRVRSFLRARIIYNNNNSTIDCIIKNFSSTGAKIDVSRLMSIPAEFDLDIPQKGRVFRARIAWRDGDSLGVEFIDQNESRHMFDSRVEILERENKRLKTTIAAMAKKLDDLGHSMSQFD